MTELEKAAVVKEVKSIMPEIDRIANLKKLSFDYGYIMETPPYWECEFYNKETGETIESYKAPTTEELLKAILA